MASSLPMVHHLHVVDRRSTGKKHDAVRAVAGRDRSFPEPVAICAGIRLACKSSTDTVPCQKLLSSGHGVSELARHRHASERGCDIAHGDGLTEIVVKARLYT